MSQSRHAVTVALSLVAAGAVVVFAGAAGAAGSGASASASASARAAPSGSASAPPPPPSIVRGTDIPAERSSMPKPAEWAQAKPVKIGEQTVCEARLLREWLMLRCDQLWGASLVAGDPKDVRVTANGHLLEWDPVVDKMKPSFVEITIPIERGKARLLTLLDLSGGSGDYGPAMPGEGMSLSVWWRDGQADPFIVGTRPD